MGVIKECIYTRYKGHLEQILPKLVPRVSLEPGVIFDFIGTIEAQAVLRFALDQAINKVSAFDAPARRDLLAFNLHLFRKYVIPDLLPRLANIRPL